ncbi:hypothetical protein R4Z09_25730 [Niallia oryzisoli]|uniref:Uncharacterized protein n=1 Tax=Niallia oryzisoli TaxID=1737571 RepID=A0ABZ2CC39_9BACI
MILVAMVVEGSYEWLILQVVKVSEGTYEWMILQVAKVSEPACEGERSGGKCYIYATPKNNVQEENFTSTPLQNGMASCLFFYPAKT